MRGLPTLQLLEKTVTIPAAPENRGLIKHIEKALSFRFVAGEIPVRLAIASIEDGNYICEVGFLVGSDVAIAQGRDSIFTLRRRSGENAGQFNAVYIVPTGICAKVGGHVGDATPAAQLLGSFCD